MPDKNEIKVVSRKELDQEPTFPPRLAYSLKAASQILGVSYISAFRLTQRGLLKSSSALRTKIISKVEIERFLRDTTPPGNEIRRTSKKQSLAA